MKNCIKGKEFKFYDILKSAQEGLKNEFFAAYPTKYPVANFNLTMFFTIFAIYGI